MGIPNKEIIRLQKASKLAQEAFAQIPKEHFRMAFDAQKMLANFSIPTDEFKQLQKASKRISELRKTIDFSALSSHIAEIQKKLSSIAWEQFLTANSLAKKTLKQLQFTEKLMREANEALIQIGWWVYPEWSLLSLKEVVTACKEGRNEEIRQEIIEFFNKDRLIQLTKKWKKNSKLTHRYKSLKDAVWAHDKKKYTLSIPALLPHIEGIINENSGQTGHISHKRCLSILKKYMDSGFKEGSLSSFYPLALLQFTEQLLSLSFEWGKPSQKGRHAILHGHYTDYDDEEYSLKLILLIDFLQNIIKGNPS